MELCQTNSGKGQNMKHKIRLITIGLVFFIAIVLIATYLVTKTVNSFFDKNYLVFNKAVIVKFNKPVEIKKREPKIVENKIILDYPEEINTPIEIYICEKFGMYDCKTALAIVKAESGFNDQAINVNVGGSVDLGCWQINFPTHIKTISPADALDCYKATDWAFAKYKRDGNFGAWVAFTTNKYMSHL